MWVVPVLILLALIAAALGNLALLLLLLLLVVLCNCQSSRSSDYRNIVALEHDQTADDAHVETPAQTDTADSPDDVPPLPNADRVGHEGDDASSGGTAPVRLALHSTTNDHPADLNVPHFENQMQRNLVNAPLPSGMQRQQFAAFLAEGFCNQKDKWMVEEESPAPSPTPAPRRA